MEHNELRAQARGELTDSAPQLRRQGKIPAVVYGHGASTRSLVLEAAVFSKLWHSVGETTLFDLVVGSEAPVKVLVQDVQLHPVNHVPIHVDLHQVKMTEKISASIPLSFIGESPAVKEQGGILVKSLDAIRVECLPADLVHEFTVDISRLASFEDAIRVSDLAVPSTLTVLENADEVIATVAPPRSEAELAELEEKVEEKVETVGTVEKEKKAEEDESAAGEGQPETT